MTDDKPTIAGRAIKVIKMSDVPQVPFDKEMALLEAHNFERSMRIHLKRCDCKDAAREILEILTRLSKEFSNKTG